jgi:hypothetical protein
MLLEPSASHPTQNCGRFVIGGSARPLFLSLLYLPHLTPSLSSSFLQQDTVSLNAHTTPDFPTKKAIFFEEHIHEDAEVRLIVQGVGFFDIRNNSDDWVRKLLPKVARPCAHACTFQVRVCVEAGDLLVLPAGIYHRFCIDEQVNRMTLWLSFGDRLHLTAPLRTATLQSFTFTPAFPHPSRPYSGRHFASDPNFFLESEMDSDRSPLR